MRIKQITYGGLIMWQFIDITHINTYINGNDINVTDFGNEWIKFLQ